MKVIIDKNDLSKLFYRYGISEQAKKRYGKNGGDALSGEKIIDLLSVKKTVILTCNPMTTAEKNALSAACAADYVTLTYNANDGIDQDVTITAIPSLSAAKTALKVGGTLYWSGITVTMEEK